MYFIFSIFTPFNVINVNTLHVVFFAMVNKPKNIIVVNHMIYHWENPIEIQYLHFKKYLACS